MNPIKGKILWLAFPVAALLPFSFAQDSQLLSGTALGSFTIVLREGVEAVLLIGAITGYLLASGQGNMVKTVYAWAAAAVAACVVTALAAEKFFASSEVNVALLSGLTMLAASAVLLYVTNWLLGKVNAGKWNAYISGMVGDALNSGSGFALGLAAFLAVYREGVEAVLFLKALSVGSADPHGILTGVLAAALVLLAALFLVTRVEAKLPLGPVFSTTSALLFLLSLKFAGDGVHELQEAHAVSETALSFGSGFQWIGVYPTVESSSLQFAMLVAGVALLYIHFNARQTRT